MAAGLVSWRSGPQPVLGKGKNELNGVQESWHLSRRHLAPGTGLWAKAGKAASFCAPMVANSCRGQGQQREQDSTNLWTAAGLSLPVNLAVRGYGKRHSTGKLNPTHLYPTEYSHRGPRKQLHKMASLGKLYYLPYRWQTVSGALLWFPLSEADFCCFGCSCSILPSNPPTPYTL